MINVLLDELPSSYICEDGSEFVMDFNFRTGIMACQLQYDADLTSYERSQKLIELLFDDGPVPPADELENCINFYISGWSHDKANSKKSTKRLSDYDIDQWRIFSAFVAQYHIDLNEVDYMHFWKFMGLLTTLNECAYTRVIEIRDMEIDPKTDKQYQRKIKEAKSTYELPEIRTVAEQEEEADIYDFLGGNLDFSEKKRLEEFERYADKG